jgi:Polysaccharide deacetylase
VRGRGGVRDSLKPLIVAARGKGIRNMVRRVGVIGSRYGLGPRRMERRLAEVHRIVAAHGGRATLPVTVAAARRSPSVIARYADLGIEFAVHGHTHVDHRQLSADEQAHRLRQAREDLQTIGVRARGFRAPYLRANDDTIRAVRGVGFSYDSSQAFHWPLDERIQTEAYRRGLEFCSSLAAEDHPLLPWFEDGLVRIPCSLPDDEAMVDRLGLDPREAQRLWVAMLDGIVQRGELFVVALHPERIQSCRSAVIAVLQAARRWQPPVWLAPLEAIGDWWRRRSEASVMIRDDGPASIRVQVRGPEGLTILARGINLRGDPWSEGYSCITGTDVVVPARPRPFLGIHPSSSPSVAQFLREQGYIVESAVAPGIHSHFIRLEDFPRSGQRPLLSELERGTFPLVRLGRWPSGARSALSVTGDVDALTIWDYASRFLSK